MQWDVDKKPFFLNWAVLSVFGAISFDSGIYYLYHLQTTMLFVVQALLAIFTLEAGNYIEHYGLRRKSKQMENMRKFPFSIVEMFLLASPTTSSLKFKTLRSPLKCVETLSNLALTQLISSSSAWTLLNDCTCL
jgi:hypothetical protein